MTPRLNSPDWRLAWKFGFGVYRDRKQRVAVCTTAGSRFRNSVVGLLLDEDIDTRWTHASRKYLVGRMEFTKKIGAPLT
ncbi:hypothetical protein GFPCMMHI_06674 [Ensifer adhaerens]|nr:hypothetical protein [Ensifer adhaerens]